MASRDAEDGNKEDLPLRALCASLGDICTITSSAPGQGGSPSHAQWPPKRGFPFNDIDAIGTHP